MAKLYPQPHQYSGASGRGAMGIPNHGEVGLSLCEQVATSAQGIWKAEPSSISQLTPLQGFSRTSAQPLCSRGPCPSPHCSGHLGAWAGAWRATSIFRKAQPTGTGTTYLAIQLIPFSCWSLVVHPA